MLSSNPRTLEAALFDLISRRQTSALLKDERELLDRMIGDLENEISVRCRPTDLGKKGICCRDTSE